MGIGRSGPSTTMSRKPPDATFHPSGLGRALQEFHPYFGQSGRGIDKVQWLASPWVGLGAGRCSFTGNILICGTSMAQLHWSGWASAKILYPKGDILRPLCNLGASLSDSSLIWFMNALGFYVFVPYLADIGQATQAVVCLLLVCALEYECLRPWTRFRDSLSPFEDALCISW